MYLKKGTQNRKTRSDKKKAIAPYIHDELREMIYRLARHLDLCEGDTGVKLIQVALENRKCIEFFSRFFKRSYQFSEDQLFIGHATAADILPYLQPRRDTSRFKVKVSQTLSDQLFEFQIALGTPYIAYATHALLIYSLSSKEIIQEVAPTFSMPSGIIHHQTMLLESIIDRAPVKQNQSEKQAANKANIVKQSKVWSIN